MRYQSFAETGWDPFSDLRGLQQEMGRLFDRFGGEGQRVSTYPALNLWANDEEAVVTAELPGVEVAELDISVLRDQLTLSGERKQDEVPEGAERHRTEQVCGRFSRTIQLPFEVEESTVEAAYRAGVLRLTLPRAEATRPRKIKIEPETD